MKQYNYERIKISIILLIGLSLGWLGCLMIGLNKIEHKVGYVSKEEILNLEKARVAQAQETTLFKGKAAHSAQIINKIGRSLENEYLKVIFTLEKVAGKGVISLSKKVHEETIKELEQETAQVTDKTEVINEQ